MGLYCYVLFFFQAEDGIRDLVRSRGLGDVYKRQLESIPYKQAPRLKVKLPKRQKAEGYREPDHPFRLSLIHI